jgi:hypothetical protein
MDDEFIFKFKFTSCYYGDGWLRPGVIASIIVAKDRLVALNMSSFGL